MKLRIAKSKNVVKHGLQLGLSAAAVAGSFTAYNVATAPKAKAEVNQSSGRIYIEIGGWPRCYGVGSDCMTTVI